MKRSSLWHLYKVINSIYKCESLIAHFEATLHAVGISTLAVAIAFSCSNILNLCIALFQI